MEKAGLKNNRADPFLFYPMHEDNCPYVAVLLVMDLSLVTRMKKLKCF